MKMVWLQGRAKVRSPQLAASFISAVFSAARRAKLIGLNPCVRVGFGLHSVELKAAVPEDWQAWRLSGF
jgi:hypothetical protein